MILDRRVVPVTTRFCNNEQRHREHCNRRDFVYGLVSGREAAKRKREEPRAQLERHRTATGRDIGSVSVLTHVTQSVSP